MPISAFAGDDSEDPVVFLPRLFGPGTTVWQKYHCAPVGGWLSGWTVIVPSDEGVHAFAMNEHDPDHYEEDGWANMSRGRRVDLLTRSVQAPKWTTIDLPALVLKLVKRMQYNGGPDSFDFDAAGALNRRATAWVLAHALADLSEAEAAGVWMMMGLQVESEMLHLCHRLVTGVENITANRAHVEEAERVTVAAYESMTGVTLRGAELERLGVPGALMTYPRAVWEDEAERLVASALARDPDFCGDVEAARAPKRPARFRYAVAG